MARLVSTKTNTNVTQKDNSSCPCPFIPEERKSKCGIFLRENKTRPYVTKKGNLARIIHGPAQARKAALLKRNKLVANHALLPVSLLPL